jgi:tetratricopeptide (TPR) repeat protein
VAACHPLFLYSGSTRVMFLLVVLLLATFAPVRAEQPDSILQNAIQLHKSGNIQGAVDGYKEYLKLRPDSTEARSNLGAALAKLGYFEDAIAEYKQALRRAPGNPGIALNLAIAYYKLGDVASASKELAALAATAPGNNQVTLLLADCWLQLGENRKVIDLLTPLGNQDDLGITYMLGTALIRDKQVIRGQYLLDRILKNGDSAEARLLMGTAKLDVLDYAGALQDLSRAVELNPKLASVYGYYGQALMATGDTPAAVAAFRKELEQNPNDFDSHLNLAALLKQDQAYDDAVQHLERAIRVRPGDLRARYQLATIQLAVGKLEQARKDLESIVKEAPTFTEAHVSLATLYYRLKRKADGDRERALVLKLNADAQAKQPGSANTAAVPAPGKTLQ